MKKFLSVFLVLTLIVSIIPMSIITASAESLAISGTCGENLIWEFDEVTGTLTISGAGEMYDYFSETCPWEDYKENIISVVVCDDVTTIGNSAFKACTSLMNVTIYSGVTEIDDWAFYECENLTNITIGDGVTTIGWNAFAYCYNLTSIVISDSVTTIGNDAFYYCESLADITIPSSVKSIGSGAFYNTAYYNDTNNWDNNVIYIGKYLIEANKSISHEYCVKNGTTVIADGAFDYCDNLTSITIPDSVTTIGEHAFQDCFSLTSVTIPNSVTSIGDYAFSGTGFTSVTIPDSVTEIGDSAFEECLSLKDVVFGSNVATIGNYMFFHCTNLTSVTIPDSVTTIGEHAFQDCFSLTSVTIPGSVTSIGDYAFSGTILTSVIIPECVTWIGNYAFSDTSLTSITIPEGVTSIGDGTFYNCVRLTSVTIPDSVTSIGFCAFERCTSLASITIPDSVTLIDDAFGYCNSLVSINVDSNNEYYSSDEFGVLFNKDKTELIQYPVGNTRTSYTIPDGVVTIGEYSFYEGSNLISITIPNSVTSIGSYAFGSCYNLINVTIPDSVTHIGRWAFGNTAYYENSKTLENGVYYLDKILVGVADSGISGHCEIKDGTVLISDGAFYGCENLESVTIPDSVTSIGRAAFKDCWGLTDVVIGNGVTTIGDETFAWTQIKDLTIPDSVTTIGESAFAYCDTLVNLSIGNGVTTINDFAFYFCCNITNIIIPDSVTYIGDSAFGVWTRLTDVYYLGTEEDWESISVGSGNSYLKNATIHFVGEETHKCLYETSVTLPTCTEKGYTTYICECGSSYVDDYISALGHEYTSEITKSATHTSKGIRTFTCIRCPDSYTEEISVDPNHQHTPKVTPPTCTERGYTTYICECGDSYVREYTEPLGHKNITIVLTTATCKQQGMQYNMCEECGETLSDIVFIPTKSHVLGDWEVTVEATENSVGEKVQKCTACGEVINKEIIPTLDNEGEMDKTVDEKTGVELEYQKDGYDGEVDITVEETLDETALSLVDAKTDASNVKLFNITMTVDGVEIQPNGKVIIRIPLPAGFNPESSYIAYIDTVTGNVEKMPTTYENGYLVFETTHFSYYAVVEEVVIEYKYSFSIQTPSRTEIRNKDGIILHANLDGDAPAGCYVKWESSNGNFDMSADGSSLKVIAKNKGYTMFTAILCDAGGNTLACDSVEMYSKSGFFDKIGGFFRSLFGTTKIYEN